MSATNMPIQLSVQTGADLNKHQPSSASQPTPPITPIGNAPSINNTPNYAISPVSLPRSHLKGTLPDLQTVTSPRKFTDELEFHYNHKGRKVEFGRGVWSVVYMASSRALATPSSAMSPPSSPASRSRVVAVKTPVRRDAHPVLDAEALVLTRLSMVSGFEDHIVPFHGFIADSHSIVMSAVPLALSTYIEEKAGAARQHMSTRTMFDPVQGMPEWHGLAKKLVAGLAWLHTSAQIVHGDIKPHNLLLRPRSAGNNTASDDFPFEALFADFSSAHPIADGSSSPTKDCQGTALTALTPPFAAPELLCVSSLTSPDAVPTPASDVFSLAVTLLAAATGDLLLYPGTSSMQRLAMAREGHRVLDFARSGESGCRIPRNGIVEQIVKPAILKDPSQRIHPTEWSDLVSKIMV
ncbi:protein kinase domain-containing protein [Aspergillus clavatus NRRL 1]|uniref:Protein kinase domain-containing protein n=1 Tax=Aspergillus clavatus (strain ATCC 1007 / CBS 513.65 / DSM 816 / NCTC 3887 / NRRL 1 / QM 1276 / 107) TaxID=344612 RepID=A1CJZ0_ASPCL|nr:protein kinase domain-containing protein [Aspergillus clavatus NRRL 1]EAW09464.1 protein kinase domain-containing protein [Aspergillus clavatus NRRL 1]